MRVHGRKSAGKYAVLKCLRTGEWGQVWAAKISHHINKSFCLWWKRWEAGRKARRKGDGGLLAGVECVCCSVVNECHQTHSCHITGSINELQAVTPAAATADLWSYWLNSCRTVQANLMDSGAIKTCRLSSSQLWKCNFNFTDLAAGVQGSGGWRLIKVETENPCRYLRKTFKVTINVIISKLKKFFCLLLRCTNAALI